MLNSPGLQECRLLSVLPVSTSINFPEEIRVWNCRWQNKYLATFGIFKKIYSSSFLSPSLVEFLFAVSRERTLVVDTVELLLGRELRGSLSSCFVPFPLGTWLWDSWASHFAGTVRILRLKHNYISSSVRCGVGWGVCARMRELSFC